MERFYKSVSGHDVHLDDASEESLAFLDRVRVLVDDPKASEADVIALAYSRENPFLDQSIFPGRGAVTREVLQLPEYHVLADLVARKRLIVDRVDIEKLAAEFTVSVREAARQLGVSESAIRQAIATHRLASFVKDGQHFMRPSSIASFEVGTRGPRPLERVRPSPLEVCMGNVEGTSFRVRMAGELQDKENAGGHKVTGRITAWHRIGVISGGGGRHRFFEIEPSDEENEIKLGPFYLRGKFRFVRKVNGEEAARDAWKKFEAA